MAQVLNQFNNQVQSLPFYNQVTGLYEDQMGERFSTKDPFYEKIPQKDKRDLKPGEKMEYKEIRRKPPTNISEKQRKLWKRIIKRAWYHDRNFCGCMPIDLGCGMISIISIFPIIGSAIAYKMHYKMIKMCNEAGCPKKIQAEMVGNIGLDFAITLVPLLGVILSWMKASSTRNAALFDTWLREQSNEKDAMQQRQNHQQSKLQRPGQPPGGGPTQPPPSATQAPPTQSQRQTHSRAPRSTATNGSTTYAQNAARQGSPTNADPRTAKQQRAPQRRPVPNSTQGHAPRPQTQQQQPSAPAPQGVISQSPASSSTAGPKLTSPPPYQDRSILGSTSTPVPIEQGPSPPHVSPPQAPPHTIPAPPLKPPVPPKIPSSSPEPRRIPPAGSYDFGSRSSSASPYISPSRSPVHTSPQHSVYGSPQGSSYQYGSPYNSPYGSPQGPPSAFHGSPTYESTSPGVVQPSSRVAQSHPNPPAHSAPPRTGNRGQKYFMQSATRAHPDVVEL